MPEPAIIEVRTFGDRIVEQLVIESEPGVLLAASLHTPLGRGRAPFPVVIALTGGGRGGRHTFDFLKDRLLADGIAMVEFDKRGVYRSSGEFTDSLAVVERDAEAVVAFARTRPELDMARFGLIGLCQGAVVAPSLAVREPGVAGVVMLAGPVGAGSVLFLQQMRDCLLAGGVAEAPAARIVGATGRLFDARTRGMDDTVVSRLREAVIAAFVAAGFTPQDGAGATDAVDTPDNLSIWTSRPDRTLAQVRVPVLALYASIDLFVPPATNMPAAQAALSDNPDATVLEIPSMNHIFQRGVDGTLEEMRTLGAPNSDPHVVDTVAGWLGERLHGTPAPHAVPATATITTALSAA